MPTHITCINDLGQLLDFLGLSESTGGLGMLGVLFSNGFGSKPHAGIHGVNHRLWHGLQQLCCNHSATNPSFHKSPTSVAYQPATHLFINHPLLSISQKKLYICTICFGQIINWGKTTLTFLFLAFLDYNANAKVHLVGNCNILQLSKLQFSFSQGYAKICLWFSVGKTSKLYHI